MAVDSRTIGVFDSGIGGLTVVREIFRELPNEPVLFFGDTARLPYGPKSPETVLLFSRQNARFLLSRGVGTIVVACNTASAVALDDLKRECPVPVLGVIEPGASAAVRRTRNGVIGVIGTHGTIASRSYEKAIAALDPKIKVHSAPCPLLVPLAEEGWGDSDITRQVAVKYLEPLLDRSIDTLILGCTHFPVLKKAIRAAVGPDVFLVDTAEEAARCLSSELGGGSADGTGRHEFVVSDIPHRFLKEAELFLGRSIGDVERIHPEHLEEFMNE